MTIFDAAGMPLQIRTDPGDADSAEERVGAAVVAH
jgi:hypothetical protein